jgi:hypothetical protein
MSHTYNHSYSGGKDWKDSGSKTAWAKKLAISISINKNMGMVMPA